METPAQRTLEEPIPQAHQVVPIGLVPGIDERMIRGHINAVRADSAILLQTGEPGFLQI